MKTRIITAFAAISTACTEAAPCVEEERHEFQAICEAQASLPPDDSEPQQNPASTEAVVGGRWWASARGELQGEGVFTLDVARATPDVLLNGAPVDATWSSLRETLIVPVPPGAQSGDQYTLTLNGSCAGEPCNESRQLRVVERPVFRVVDVSSRVLPGVCDYTCFDAKERTRVTSVLEVRFENGPVLLEGENGDLRFAFFGSGTALVDPRLEPAVVTPEGRHRLRLLSIDTLEPLFDDEVILPSAEGEPLELSQTRGFVCGDLVPLCGGPAPR
jgi:hypothetical protein